MTNVNQAQVAINMMKQLFAFAVVVKWRGGKIFKVMARVIGLKRPQAMAKGQSNIVQWHDKLPSHHKSGSLMFLNMFSSSA